MTNKFLGLFFCLALVSTIAKAQAIVPSSEKPYYQHQIEAGTDNDFFAFITDRDRSYTYGLNATYRFIPKRKNFMSKLFPQKQYFFHSILASLEAYTPNYDYETGETTGIRPFAGWLYLNFGSHYAFEKSMLTLTMDIGILGPASQAGQIQNWFHRKISGDTELKGWDRQIPNQLGLNLKANYVHDIYNSGNFDLFGGGEVSLGNIRTYILPRAYLRFGKFNEIQRTLSLSNSILAGRNEIEYYVQASAGYNLTFYDGTLQGNLFSGNRDSRTIDDINHHIFEATFGGYIGYHRFAFSAVYHLRTGEVKTIQRHAYVSLKLGYRF